MKTFLDKQKQKNFCKQIWLAKNVKKSCLQKMKIMQVRNSELPKESKSTAERISEGKFKKFYFSYS